jgi:hypothetical protein
MLSPVWRLGISNRGLGTALAAIPKHRACCCERIGGAHIDEYFPFAPTTLRFRDVPECASRTSYRESPRTPCNNGCG